MPDTEPPGPLTPEESSVSFWIVALWVALGLALALGSAALIRREKAATLRLWEARLSILADEEATLVGQWIASREGDARLLAGLPAVRALAAGRTRAGAGAGPGVAGTDLKESVNESLRRIAETYGYRAIELFDAGGHVVAEIGEPVLDEPERLAEDVVRSGQRDRRLLPETNDATFTLALAEPVFALVQAPEAAAQAPVGAVLLIPDPKQTLFRLFKSDPLPTLTDEAYIVVLQGNRVRSISPRLLLPTESFAESPAADSPQDRFIRLGASQEFGQFLDGRGHSVLAAKRSVPAVGWFVIEKIDRDEALQSLTDQALWVAVSAVAIFLAVTMLGLVWRRRAVERRHREIQERETRYRALLEKVQDGVIVEQDGAIEFANPAAVKMLGDEGGLVRRRFLDFVAPESHEKISKIRLARLAGQAVPDRYEVVGLRRDGSRFDLELTAAATELDGRAAVQATLRDVTVRREIERALTQSERRYRLLFERNLAGVYRASPSGQILECNDAFARIMGYDSAREAMAQPCAAFYADPQERDRVLELLKNQRSLTNIEIRARRKDGAFAWVLETASIAGGDGAVAEVIEGTLIDISERKRAEEALQESQDRFRLLTEASLEGIVISEGGIILDANRQFASLLGFQPEDVIGRSVLDFASLESREDIAQRIREHIEGSYETTCIRQDGSTFPVEVSARTMPHQGRTIRVTAVRDITQRKRAQDELLRSERRHRSIVDMAPIGIYQSRLDGSFVIVNAKLAEMLGYDSPEELLSKNLKEIYVYPAEREALIAQDTADRARRIELEWRKKDGSRIWVEVNAHTIESEIGQELHFEGFVHDVTDRRLGEEERRTLEHQLIQSQKIEAVGQLAGGIAHDFNNILTSITGYTELLAESLDAADPRRAHAQQIRLAARRATSLTQQLLAFSRRQMLEPKILDLNKVVSGMEDMLRRLIGEHIELRVHTALDLCTVKADPGQLEQAILNLVVNARDAMPEGGKLMIETANAELDAAYATVHMPASPGHYGMVAVTDTGSGMSPEVKARLFEPFFTTKGLGKGTGLGLSTTYGIVKQSGGYIWCYSEPGRGTSFKIYLPRVDDAGLPAAPVGPATASISASAPSGKETILLVEDETEVRALVMRLLKMQGYTVVAAANPDEALAIMRDFQGTIDLMLTDVVMPGMSGRQLADRIAVMRPGLKVLFVSGYADDAIVHHGVLDPGTAFLQKPFSPQALARKLREVIEAPPGQFKVS